MLYIYTGTDYPQVRAQAHDRAAGAAASGDHVEHIEPAACTAALLRDRIGAQSLFSHTPQVVVIDTPSEQAGALDIVCEYARELASSHNTFVLIERKIPAPAARTLKRDADEYHEVVVASGAAAFNTFRLADAYARRDKKMLWLLFREAYTRGISDEEIIGILLWQTKMLRLAVRTTNATEAGQKPFVYSKAQRALAHFKHGEPDVHAGTLLSIYHDARAGRRDMSNALEQWILSL